MFRIFFIIKKNLEILINNFITCGIKPILKSDYAILIS